MVFDTSISDPLARVQAFWQLMAQGTDTFDTQLYPHIRPIAATAQTPTSPSTTTFSLHIHPSLTNRMNNLHGGAAALIFDLCTSVALGPIASGGTNQDPSASASASASTSTTARPPTNNTNNNNNNTKAQTNAEAEAKATANAAPFWLYPGVSRTLDVVYHRPAQAGWECRLVCTVVSVGKRLAHIRGEIRRWLPDDDGGRMGEVLCTCEHGKVGIVVQKL